MHTAEVRPSFCEKSPWCNTVQISSERIGYIVGDTGGKHLAFMSIFIKAEELVRLLRCSQILMITMAAGQSMTSCKCTWNTHQGGHSWLSDWALTRSTRSGIRQKMWWIEIVLHCHIDFISYCCLFACMYHRIPQASTFTLITPGINLCYIWPLHLKAM